MSTRRTFLGTVGLSLASVPYLIAKGLTERRGRLEMIFNDDPVLEPRFHPEPSTWGDRTITAAWIGHSTILLNFFGVNIITDPVFSERIGLNIAGLLTIGPRRLVQPALTIDQLPHIDLILLSHAHFDHLDLPSLKEFDRNIPLIMAKNTADVIEDLGFTTVYELDWGKWTRIGDLRVEALEVKHFGWRYPWEQDRSRGNMEGRSYNAYLLTRNQRHIVFGGDTAMHDHFKDLARRNITVELAMMPIGAYDPWIHAHASPEQALAMADQMGAFHVLPMHWRTFVQSEEPTLEPMARLKKAAASNPDRIVLNSIGETWTSDISLADHETPDPLSEPGRAVPGR